MIAFEAITLETVKIKFNFKQSLIDQDNFLHFADLVITIVEEWSGVNPTSLSTYLSILT